MDTISFLDIVFSLALLASMGTGFARGFLRQLTDLAALYVGLAVSAQYTPMVAATLNPLVASMPYYLISALVFFGVMSLVGGVLSLAAHVLMRPGGVSRRELSDISQVGGLVLAAFQTSAVIAISIPVLRYAISASWGSWDATREVLVRAVNNSYLVPIFNSFTPSVVAAISPLLPGGLPDVLRGRAL